MKLFFLIFFSFSFLYSQNNRFEIFENNLFGFIDSTGKVVIKPQFTKVGKFSEGWASFKQKSKTGYINENGEIVIQPQFDYGVEFKEGLACVFKDKKCFFINKLGQKMLDANYYMVGSFENGLAVVKNSNKKLGIIDKSGKLVLDTIMYEIQNFYRGFSIIRDTFRRNNLINLKGEIVLNSSEYSKDNFYKKTGFEEDEYYDKYEEEKNLEYYFYQEKDNTSEIKIVNYFFEEGKLIGVLDKNKNILLKPFMEKVYGKFECGILSCIINNKHTYVDFKGNIIWQANDTTKFKYKKYETEFYSGTRYRAVSKKIEEDSKFNFPKDSLCVIVHDTLKSKKWNNYQGIYVTISNLTSQKAYINSIDGRLEIKIQALDEDGKWKDIENNFESNCGNSYSFRNIDTNCYMSFTIPKFKGDYKTKLRLAVKTINEFQKVLRIDTVDISKNRIDKVIDFKKINLTLYSNEFDGSINKSQFWLKNFKNPEDKKRPLNWVGIILKP